MATLTEHIRVRSSVHQAGPSPSPSAPKMAKGKSFSSVKQLSASQIFTVKPAGTVSPTYMQKYTTIPIPPYFWGAEHAAGKTRPVPPQTGNIEAGVLIGDGSIEAINQLVKRAIAAVEAVFRTIEHPDPTSRIGIVELRLSPELAQWKRQRQSEGRVLPCKGHGLARPTEKSIDFLGATAWPTPLLPSNALFGVIWTNMLQGAYDPKVLYSNSCVDMAFYYEHGYNNIFPEFETIFNGVLSDPHALTTHAGLERREGARIGCQYIRGKVALEKKYLPFLSSGQSAKLDRKTAQTIMFGESSLVGMAVEAIYRGYDAPAVNADIVFSSPATDVVDVGSDVVNCECMNSFLNTADITNTGIVSEETLRKVYDAYSHACARIFTERWNFPTSIMNSLLYEWHILNDRHKFFRRAVLGYEKIRKSKPRLREADMDEVFDEDYHTTGFSRPLKNACNGQETCDQVLEVIQGHPRREILSRLWHCLVTDPLAYAKAGIPDDREEDKLIRAVQELQAECWHEGLVWEIGWISCHASLHAWQVNFLMEAAMWGSFLDDGALAGKLDRAD